jgi:hypothetical protein
MNIDLAILEAVVTEAKAKAADQPRWLKAIDKAADELLLNPYVHFENGMLLVLSSTSGTIYEVTSSLCFCQAFWAGKPCYHRALHRLITRCLNYSVRPAGPVTARAEALTHASAPLRKPEGRDRYTINGWDL